MTNSACDDLAKLYKAQAENEGLLDVKFFVRSVDGTSKEAICAEALRLEEAIAAGAVKPLVFNDERP